MTKRLGLARYGIGLALILCTLVLGAPLALAEGDGVVRMYYFVDPQCEVCKEVRVEIVEPLQAEYGDRLVVEERSIADGGGFELMLDLEMRYGVASGSIPEAFIGEDVLIGGDEIRDHLAERVAHYATQGGVALPTTSEKPTVPEATLAPDAYTDCDTCDDKHERTSSAAADATGVVHALLLWSETCPACHTARAEVLPPIVTEYGARLQLRTVDVTGERNDDVWQAIMAALQIPRERQYIPMLLVGDHILVGGDEIGAELPRLVDEYLAAGGVPLPSVPDAALHEQPLFVAPTPLPNAAANLTEPPVIHAAYFYQPGCDECERAEHDLRYIQQKYPQVQVERFDVKEAAELNQYLCDRAGVPTQKHLTAPALFIGDDYLVADDIRVPAIESLVTRYAAEGAAETWINWEAQSGDARSSIIERFRSFGLLTVVGAGLLDGVNPCAFATMIFLISYLTMRKREGRELLATGAAFTAGVFLTYLGVGFGFLKFLSSLPFLNAVGRWIYGVTALLCLGLAWGSIVDYRRARAGRLEDMSLKLPKQLRDLSRRLIREGTSSRRFVLSSFALGFGVSVVELACTGQVYLPTIIFVLGVPEWRAQASLALLLYNVMFILPLVGVFMLVYYGTTSEQLIGWMQKHAATVKLFMAGLFVLLGGWLVYSIVVTL